MPTLGSSVASERVADAVPGCDAPTSLPRRLSRRLATPPSGFDGAFSPRARRLGLAYVCLGVALATALSTLAGTPREYLLVAVVLGTGTFTTPALVVTWLALGRIPQRDRRWTGLWLAALALMQVVGIGMMVGLATGWRVGNPLGAPLVAVIGGLFIAAIVGIVRVRSGRRALTVDVIEGGMAVVVVVAPCALIWGESVLSAEAPWFAVPASLAMVALVAGSYWAIALFARLGPAAGPVEISGVILALGGSLDAAAQTAQGVSGFALPVPPLAALHATSVAMLLLVPLYLPRQPVAGLDRLPPQAQVRSGRTVALVTLVGVPVLVAVALWMDGRNSWALPFALGTLVLLLVLGGLRHLTSLRETRRLYAQVEQAAGERRALLAEVMQRADEDRHRVAAQLHEQAVSAYASFVSFIQACGTTGPNGAPSPLTGASNAVRDDLARHADSLRQLMLAIRPLESSGTGSGPQTLTAPIHAYLDSLYGDERAPRLNVTVQDGLVLDWISETIALRVVQEAVRNVWRHSRASDVDVSIGIHDGAIELRVADDGVGFDPSATLFESGIGTMRSFAAVIGGDVDVSSAPGAGTTVTARLSGDPAVPAPAAAVDTDTTDDEDTDTDMADDEGIDLDASAEAGTPAEASTAAPTTRPRLRLVRGAETRVSR